MKSHVLDLQPEMTHKHHSFWSSISFVSICIKYLLMYQVQKDVCIGNHTSGIGPHSSMRHDTLDRPWYRNLQGRIHAHRHSIQEDRRCWQILYMAFQQLWAKKKKRKKQLHTTIQKYLLFDFPKWSLSSALTWQLSQQLPWAQADPRVNLQVAASQHLLPHSWMKWNKWNLYADHHKSRNLRLPECFYSTISEAVTWHECSLAGTADSKMCL